MHPFEMYDRKARLKMDWLHIHRIDNSRLAKKFMFGDVVLGNREGSRINPSKKSYG